MIKMFENCWPFPQHEQIVKDFPKQEITAKVYSDAKEFYHCSVTTEAHLLMDFVRQNNEAGERRFAEFLVRQAIHVALGHFENGC